MKIGSYENDNNISLSDKVSGTDADDNNKTKNYTFQKIKDFLIAQGLGSNVDVSGKENVSNKSTNVNTDANSDIKYPSVKAVKTYVDGVVNTVDTTFTNKPYSGTMVIAYDSENPNFEIDLTGNLTLSVTGTSNGDSGLVNLYFSATEVATINGFSGLSITGEGEMIPIYFIHDSDGIKWYDTRIADVDTSSFALQDGTTLWHTAVATNVGTFSNIGTACTGIGTTIINEMIGAKIIKANGEIGIITARASNTSFTVTGFSTDSIDTTFEIKCVATKINTDGSIENFGKNGSRIEIISDFNSKNINGVIFNSNGNVNLGGQVVTHGNNIIMYGSSGEIIVPFFVTETIYNVGNLPTPSGTKRVIAWVSDATTPTYRGVYVGGGAISCQVSWDGTNWRT